MVGQIVGAVAGAVVSKALGSKAGGSAGGKAGENLAQANALNAEQIDLAKEQLKYSKDLYANWQAVYGDIQDNLGEYYKNLSVDKVTTLGLQNQQLEFQKAVKLLEKEAAKKGISDSGIEFTAKTNAAFQNAEAKAKIRTFAPEVVAQAQQGFLTLGLGSQPALLGNVSNANAVLSNSFASGISANSGVAQSYINQQTTLAEQQNSFAQDIGGGIGGFIGNKLSG